MEKPQVLKNAELRNFLSQAARDTLPAVMSYMYKGKWHTAHVNLAGLSQKFLQVELDPAKNTSLVRLQQEQPVGLSLRADTSKYIFESIIRGFEGASAQGSQGKIILSLPDRVEKMPRRTFSRAAVPDSLNVQVFFWHRGYINDCAQTPKENCWQGRLVDLSAGGLQVAIDPAQSVDFTEGQLLGLQFTPLAYEKPICVEGQIRHLAEVPEKRQVYIGIEFIGLEATYEGREKLFRIVNTVDNYTENGSSPLQEPLFGVSEIAG